MIQVLVGTVASGKSTYAKELAKEDWIIVNDDSIVNSIHSGQYTLYKEELKPLYKGVELFILNTAVAMGKNVVIDKGLSLSVNSRRRWIAIGHSLDVSVQCVLFEFFTPEIHAHRRTNTENRGHDFDYWKKAADRHFAVYEPPTWEEGFDAIVNRRWN